MDEALFRLINGTLRHPLLDAAMPVLSNKHLVIIPGALAVALAAYFGRRRTRVYMLALLLALAVADFGSAKPIKNSLQRPRPYVSLPDVRHHRAGEWHTTHPLLAGFYRATSFSFPSTHAANAAAAATALALLNAKTLWVGVPLTLLIGYSRVYTGNHYPFDVLAGFVYGVICGAAMCWIVRRLARLCKAPEPPPVPCSPERRRFYWLLAGWTLFNFAFIHLNLFDLAGDEAQYWDWSRHLALGYYSKPPLIAYVIRIFTSAGGNSEWAIRSGAVLFSSGTVALIYALTLRIAKSERAAMLATLVALAAPFTWAGSVIMTIDPLLVFFWALAMYAFHRAVNGENRFWWLTGAALGLGLLAKYTMVLLVVAFVLYLLLADRKWLRTRWPYAAAAVALALQSGVLYWNWRHDWISFRHTAAIGAGDPLTFGARIASAAEYLGGQLGAASPILFVLLIWAIWRCARRFRENRDAAFLFLSFISLFGFYALAAFSRSTHVNWPVAAYTAAAPALGWMWHAGQRSRAAQRWLTAGLVLGASLGLAARATDLLYLAGAPLDPRVDPTNKLRGGRELGAGLAEFPLAGEDAPFFFSDRYQLTAWAAFYGPGQPRVYCANLGDRRYNQYDLWDGWEGLEGRDGVFVTGGDEIKARWLIADLVARGAFESGEHLKTIEVRRGGTTIRTYTVSRLQRYTGRPWTPVEEKF